jgi:1-acyl-sn-glycerol-3-phosphate acyltransferase
VALVLGGSALGRLWAYQLAARVRGRSPQRAVHAMQRWCRWTWRWLRLDVRVQGGAPSGPCIFVANHRSYLDIPVLSGVLGATFMSRADVATWPVVGAAAKEVGAVFVERDDAHGRARAARALLRRLGSAGVIVFPEGTTTGHRLPGAFHPGLFRLLHRATVPVVPVTVRYSDRRAYWTDDITLREHLRTRVLAGPRLTCAVHIGEPLSPAAHADGTELARAVSAAVCRPIEELGELA